MFRDEANIEVIAGKGGDGAVSFRREKFVPLGGPDGGDGGCGGNVIMIASESLNSLLSIGRRHRYQAANGKPGTGQNKSGRSAEDLRIDVPVGTQVFDRQRGNLLRDLSRPGQELVVARGGAGGHGNARFANAVRQAPRIATEGKPGEQRELRLELKIFAQVGLVGLPNAGKSTFLSSVTAATPKIADYPFTTLVPQVGIAQISELETLVIADLPGLIEGASRGLGLGHRFLKHVERCRLILHLIDVSDQALTPPFEAWRVIDGELSSFSSELVHKPRIVVASKCESPDAQQRASELESEIGQPVWRISSVTHLGVEELLAQAAQRVRAAV